MLNKESEGLYSRTHLKITGSENSCFLYLRILLSDPVFRIKHPTISIDEIKVNNASIR